VARAFGVTTDDVEMKRLVEAARNVATTPYPVLLQGESGTGKELFARGIHACSGRTGPFVPLNCGAIPEALFEAELFGAEPGSYTGQVGTRRGLLRVAHQGTLFLDEVAELPLTTQAKLLRVLQDGEVRSLGAARPHQVDVRIIAATHRDVGGLARVGTFRDDLYFRLSASCITLPPIRERGRDLELLFFVVLEEAAAELDRDVPSVEPAALDLAHRYHWPGNVRELKHLVAGALLNATGDRLTVADFALLGERLAAGGADPRPTDLPFFVALEQFERDYVQDLLRRTDGNLSRAAEIAGLSRSAIRDKARRYDLLSRSGCSPGRPRRRVRRGD
jgi:two-component system response regulator GlrR